MGDVTIHGVYKYLGTQVKSRFTISTYRCSYYISSRYLKCNVCRSHHIHVDSKFERKSGKPGITNGKLSLVAT